MTEAELIKTWKDAKLDKDAVKSAILAARIAGQQKDRTEELIVRAIVHTYHVQLLNKRVKQ